jgi:hypothetical protein
MIISTRIGSDSEDISDNLLPVEYTCLSAISPFGVFQGPNYL